VDELRRAAIGFIEQARARMEARPELRDQPENFLESMLAAEENFSTEEIVGNTFTLLLAGEDTTAQTMAWTLWQLATRPDIQSRWADEAAEVLGERRSVVEYETVEGLRYGEAVLRESMRLKPVGPLQGVQPLADVEIADTHIPAKTHIWLMMRHAGLSANGVEHARDLDPDRWLEEGDGSPPDQGSFLAFGAGPRFCPGRNLAFLEAKAGMAMIARNFAIELDDSAGPVEEEFSFTMVPRGLRVRLRKRNAST
jgi:cytochrome P450